MTTKTAIEDTRDFIVRKLENNGGEMTSGRLKASLSARKREAYHAAKESLVDDGTIEVQGIDNPVNRAKDMDPAMKLILRNRATVQDTKPVGATVQDTKPVGATVQDTKPVGATVQDIKPVGATVSNRPGPREWLAKVLRLHCPSCGAQNQ